MFASFFPRSKFFLPSLILWTAGTMALWYILVRPYGVHIGFAPPSTPLTGVSMFWSPDFIWYYIYYSAVTASFTTFWQIVAPCRWWKWSLLGSSLIIFTTYLQVEVNVTITNWYGPFWDMVQLAMSHPGAVKIDQFYYGMLTFSNVAMVAVGIGVMTSFFISHYIFRWRTAMNEFYMAHWQKLRRIEGAAQRVQEDTMRFSTTTESLGTGVINAVLTLIAFMPLLMTLSSHITALPLVGVIPYPLVVAAIAWALFGTILLAGFGIKLPGLQFRNQRVEAAYRKELVYGEDDADRAQPLTTAELFVAVRKNYFRLYFNYAYFNVARMLYLQADVVFSLIVLGPSIIAGTISLGLYNQIGNAFDQVRGSFQYLINSWTDIVEWMSIYKRLRSFEAAIDNQPLPRIEF